MILVGVNALATVPPHSRGYSHVDHQIVEGLPDSLARAGIDPSGDPVRLSKLWVPPHTRG